MVRYHIHDGNERIETTERLAQSYVPEDDIQSFTSNEYHVVAVNGRQLVIDLRQNIYDVKLDSEAVGKYASATTIFIECTRNLVSLTDNPENWHASSRQRVSVRGDAHLHHPLLNAHQ